MNAKIIFSITLLLMIRLLPAQQVTQTTLQQCYEMALKNSPAFQQKALTIASGNLTENNLNFKWLPLVDINVQATYQSAVTSIPIKIPNVTLDELDKDQYKGTLELVQPLMDGGVVSRQKKLQHNYTATESQKVEVDLYQLKAVIINYYFTALLMEENIRVMELVQQDLSSSLKTVSAQVTNGISTKSNEDLLKAELLKTDQQKTEFSFVKKQAIENLALLTGASIDQQTVLSKPATTSISGDAIANRPELKLFDLQRESFQLQSKLLNAKANPKISLFANGGYGKPGLNQLKNEFQWFYISGVKLNIPIMSHFTQQRDKAVLRIQEQVVDKQKENFLRNNQQLLVKQRNEIEKYKQLVKTDAAIIELRTSIKENALVKLSNGIITTNDYIKEVNAENQARLSQQLHEVSILQAQQNYKVIAGE